MTSPWTPIDSVPDGCVLIEVLYEGGTTWQCCSCDVHWDRFKGRDVPTHWRIPNKEFADAPKT